MKYEIKSVYQRADVEEFQRVVGKTVQRGKALISKIGFFLLAVVFLVTGCAMAMSDAGAIWAVGGIIAAIVLTITIIFHHQYMAMKGWRGWKRVNGTKPISYTFDDDGFVEIMGDSEYSTPYKDVYAFIEVKDYYFLFLSKEEGYILKKADFIKGQPEAFKKYIEKQCGGRITTHRAMDR